MDLADNELPPSMGTLDINEDLYLEDMKSEVNIWGRLYPLVSHFKPLDLSKDEYSFGRGDDCDYCFNTAEINKITYFQTFSKVHFKLKRQQTNSGFYISLEDMSSNGTFINGERIGKGKKQALTGNSEICLSLPKNKVFLFMDLTNVDDNQFPAEIKEKYVVTKVLGRGACGEVRLAFTKGSCIKHAIKIIAKKKFAGDGLPPHKTVMNEVNILKKLKHPCIIRIEDVIDTPETLYIVLELSEGGELFDRVVSQGNLPEPIGKLYFFQMIHAVKYLHDQEISHRDLKPENVLLATDLEETLVKITDFGLSKLIDGNTMLKTFCGTPTYLAPEIIKTAGLGAYTKAVDCWSLGVILFICLVGYPPFSDEDKSMPLRDQIMKGHYSFPKQYWKNVSEQAIDLVKKLLTVDPKKRITLDDAINHVWFKDDNLKAKVRDLMYPNKDGMIPPNISKPGARKRPLDNVENEPLAKKSSIEAMTF